MPRYKKPVKGNPQFVQKVTFEPLMDFKQNHYGSWKCYTGSYFQKLSWPNLKKTRNYFFVSDF